MSVLIKNESQSSSLEISISRLFNGSKIYTKTLQPRQLLRIPINDLRVKDKGLPGAVLLSVQTLKKTLIWKGPVPISSNLTPIKINPKTKTVFYGGTRIPSLVSSSSSPGFSIGILCLALLIILLWGLIVRSKNKR